MTHHSDPRAARGLALVTLLVATLVTQTGQTQASQASNRRADVTVVLAHTTPGEVDPRLRAYPALFRPPFNAYRSLSILSEDRGVTGEEPWELRLLNGRVLRISLDATQPEDDGKIRVRITIQRPHGTAFLPLLQVRVREGEVFFVAGQEHEGGMLIVCIRIGPLT